MYTSVQPAFFREKQLIGDSKCGLLGLVPFSRATLWRKVRDGTFPAPVKLSSRTTAWHATDIYRWMADPEGFAATS
ncbi:MULTISPECIES: AlpA family phage regulatory protein [Acidithiobacillus]|uniref:AlpA family phage regulatory protein n=1 Tax=Acidithiobacillus TaxID=119977 RepID=UPI0009DA44AD|nr:AlpA family phage regulatory protein [Acidithiobacillus albertensis]MBU2749402.1 AlpA family phage regulatory protein [Acidithiobacillus thiooxidans]MBU2793965.1 AlpA family phage regulatory protein [Acidithiobacillus thiooxidans]MBU2837660.1 AlpA family phage regulatory protein [Acidithiobacillus thiooxidans]